MLANSESKRLIQLGMNAMRLIFQSMESLLAWRLDMSFQESMHGLFTLRKQALRILVLMKEETTPIVLCQHLIISHILTQLLFKMKILSF